MSALKTFIIVCVGVFVVLFGANHHLTTQAAEAAEAQKEQEERAERERLRSYPDGVCSIIGGLIPNHYFPGNYHEDEMLMYAQEMYRTTDPAEAAESVAKLEEQLNIRCPDDLANAKAASDAKRQETAELEAAAEAERAATEAAKAAAEVRQKENERKIEAGLMVENGTYIIGQDMQAGTWRVTAGRGTIQDCYWERSAANGGSIIANDFITAATTITVTVRNGEIFTSHECGSWEKVG